MSKVIVVTGSNKGIGLAIVKALCQRLGNNGTVYLTSRDDKRGKETVGELNKLGLYPEYYQLDVAERDSVIEFGKYLKKKHGGIDILINNAAIIDRLKGASYEESVNVIDINFKSILTLEEIKYSLIRSGGRILNISSDCGHLSNVQNSYWIERLSNKHLTVEDLTAFVNWFLEAKKNGTLKSTDIADGGTIAAYRVSKVALSAVTKKISINSLHPGVVRTSMTSGLGFYSVDQAAETPIYLVLDAPETLKGSYIWYDKRVIDWYDYKTEYFFKSSTLYG